MNLEIAQGNGLEDNTAVRATRSEASRKWKEHVVKEFDSEVKRSIESAIYGTVGGGVLKALYKHLKEQYNISPAEIPYRLDAVFETLEQTFGVKGARTLSRAIAKRLNFRLNLQFVEKDDYRLQDYVEQAKKQLRLQAD